MGWSGGTYTKGNNSTGGWTGDASLGIGIEAGRHDTQDDDFATGINACLTKDGTNSPSANLPMGGYKHTGVADATAGDEYLSYKQLLDVSKAVTTAGTSPDFTVSLTPAPTAYYDGMTFMVEAHANVTVTTGATLNVNSLGAKDIKVHRVSSNVRDVHPYEISSGAAYQVTYDSGEDAFILNNPTFGGLATWTTTIGSTSGTPSIVGSSIYYTYVNSSNILIAGSIIFGLSGATSPDITFTLPKSATTLFALRPISAYVFAVSGYASYAATSWVNGADLVVTRTDQTNFPIDANMTFRFNGIYSEA